MPKLYYQQTEGELHEPTCLVVRTLADGTLATQLNEGGNTDVNKLLSYMLEMIKEVGVESFLPMAKAAAIKNGFDLAAIAAAVDLDPDVKPADE